MSYDDEVDWSFHRLVGSGCVNDVAEVFDLALFAQTQALVVLAS